MWRARAQRIALDKISNNIIRRHAARIPPRVRDDRERPSEGRDGASCKFDLPDTESEIFFETGLDTP
jgi:hypothetical protein